MWALMGFGLSTVLCLVIPIAQHGVQQWVAQSGGVNLASRSYIFTGLSIFWSSMRAISYGLLLMAILVGRTGAQTAPGAPNPLPGNTM